MWCPAQDLDTFNRLLVQLEQAYLAVLRKSSSAESLATSSELTSLYTEIDANPHQAVAMARIKSGHTMTPRHGLNVLMLARAWIAHSHRLGDRLEPFCRAALFHDLGHWRPDDLLFVFEYFSHDEHRRMQNHATAALEEMPLTDEARTWVAQHHEQVDGKGYPKGISDPHPLAQLLRICDCYDGLTTPRRFRPAYTAHRAMVLMERWAGYKYSEGLFQSFLDFMGGMHPAGSFIRTEDGAMAVVIPPSEDGAIYHLPLTNHQGDVLDNQEPKPLLPDSIVDEGYQWQQVALPGDWRNLRPDLLNLPRYY